MPRSTRDIMNEALLRRVRGIKADRPAPNKSIKASGGKVRKKSKK